MICWKKVLIGIIILFLLLFLGFIIYSIPAKLDANVYDYLKSTDKYDYINNGGNLIFKPKSEFSKQIGFVFYQGGLVDSKGYSYLAKLANFGITVFIEDFYRNLAFFDPSRINKRIKEYQNINKWYLGGHSLGGAMACRYVASNPSKIKGLILLGSYSDRLIKDVKVLSIYGSLEDDSMETRTDNLPEDTIYVEIDGGNHTNFGMYALQKGDPESTNTKKEQQDIVLYEIENFINTTILP
jgi:hypothetical protein